MVAIVAALAFAAPAVAGPPAGLTGNGITVWNLDALMNDTFGNRVPCLNYRQANFFSVARSTGYCPAPLAAYGEYTFTFLNAFHSNYGLVARRSRPLPGTNVEPIRVAFKYVSCGGGKWLVFGHGSANANIYCS